MSSESEKGFLINDPIHGSIELKGKFLRLIIDSKEFQRLRKIKQLGGAVYVYPGATHTRFEHSIGVCYIASELMKTLKEDRTADKIIDSEKSRNGIDYEKCVKVAALCHDLGHGPYSHLYDIAVEEKYQEKKKKEEEKCKGMKEEEKKCMRHEFRSVEIFGKILKKIREENKDLQKELVNDKEAQVIGKMITFSEDCKKDEKTPWKQFGDESGETAFLYEIVANGFTGIDVDKMDYFIRDGHGLGLSSSFDWRRYIHTLKVIKVKADDGHHRLCSRNKEVHELYELFHIRNKLYRQAYRHKTTIAVECMIKNALRSADNDLLVKAQGKPMAILDAWQDIDAFLLLTDSVEDMIMQQLPSFLEGNVPAASSFYWRRCDGNECPTNILKARHTFQRIAERKLIKFLGEVKAEETKDFPSEWKSNFPEHVVEEMAKFSYGMNDKNPIELHFFYNKHDEKFAYLLSSDEVSEMLPKKFVDKRVFYYLSGEEEIKDIQKLRKDFENLLLKKEQETHDEVETQDDSRNNSS